MARKLEARLGLYNAGWQSLSENVWERQGYTALIKDTGVTIISPIGKRVERTF